MEVNLKSLVEKAKKEVEKNRAISIVNLLSESISSLTAELKSLIRAEGMDIRNGLVRSPKKVSNTKKKTTKKKVIRKKK